MISDITVINGYLWILGRNPSADEIADFQRCFEVSGVDNTVDFQNILISSEEFRNRRSHIARWMRSSPLDLSRRRIVFMHIEKCGGTTLDAMLASQFEPDLVCPEKHDGLGEWTINELAKFNLFSGHFDFVSCRSIPSDDLKIVTMLREPKARLLSLYYFWKAHVPDPGRDYRSLIGLARDHEPEEFFSHPAVISHPSIFNAMTGQLTRQRVSSHIPDAVLCLDPQDPLLVDAEAAYQKGLQVISDLTSFGVLEYFETSRVMFNKTLNLDMESIAPRQVFEELIVSNAEMRPVERRPMNDHLGKLLDPLTDIDQRLYRSAIMLFKKRAEEMRLEQDVPSGLEVHPLSRHGRS